MNYSVFLSTTDYFKDVWDPFFILFSKYWPDYKGKIYMSTEYLDYSYEGLEIVPLKVSEKNKAPKDKQAPWGQRMKWALEQVPVNIVLFLEEDFLLKNTVKTNIIDNLAEILLNDKEAKCIYLTDKGAKGTVKSKYDKLCLVNDDIFTVNCQAALWKREELLKLLDANESIWEYEIFGSKRAKAYGDIFYTVDHNWVKYNEFELIPYLYTGVFRGKWNPDVVPLFETNGINMDYNLRGVNDTTEDLLKPNRRLKDVIVRIPKYIKTYYEVYRIKKTRKLRS